MSFDLGCGSDRLSACVSVGLSACVRLSALCMSRVVRLAVSRYLLHGEYGRIRANCESGRIGRNSLQTNDDNTMKHDPCCFGGCHDVDADRVHRRRWCGIEATRVLGGGGRDQRSFVSLGPKSGAGSRWRRAGTGWGCSFRGGILWAILLLKSEEAPLRRPQSAVEPLLQRDRINCFLHALSSKAARTRSRSPSSPRARARRQPALRQRPNADVNATTRS